MTPIRRPVAFWFAVGWALLIARLTLVSNPAAIAAVAGDHWYCVVCGDAGVTDILLNLLLYLPLGMALRGLEWRLVRSALAMMAMTIAIETTQAHWLVGRDGTLGDVLMNSAGGIAGWCAYPWFRRLAHPTRTFAIRSVATLLVLMTAIWIATAAALQVDLTTATPWVGQRLHRWPGFMQFPGRMPVATFDGAAIPNDPIDKLPAWRDSLVVRLDVVRDTAWSDDRVASLVRIVDTNRATQVDVNEVGNDVMVDLRQRGDAWLLHDAKWRFPGVMAGSTGKPWRIEWRWQRDRVLLETGPVDGSVPVRREIPLTIGVGWVFIHPFVSTVSRSAPFWTALWLGWWFGLLGWLASRLRFTEWAIAATIALVTFIAAGVVSHLHLALFEVATAEISCGIFSLIGRRQHH